MSTDRCTTTKDGRRCVLAAHHDASMNATPHEFETVGVSGKVDAALIEEGCELVADARNGRFVLHLVNGAEAERLATEAGGLPS